MRVYFDTGVFIDYLSGRGPAQILRTGERRGRTPADLRAHAERLFGRVSLAHKGATSCLTFYEAEEALYARLKESTKGVSHAEKLLIPAARPIAIQLQVVIEIFKISVLDLTPGTIRLHLGQVELQKRGVRAADALHAASAIAYDADLLVSTDDSLLQLDGVLTNARAKTIICRDTDSAVDLL